MGDNFGVGFAGKFRALFFEAFPQLAKILDDAVMNNGDVVGCVGMGVIFGRLAMGSPARMADARMALERRFFQPRFEIFEFAFGAAAFEVIAFQRRNARGIIAAIFEAFERIHQLLSDRCAPENADDAAHLQNIQFFVLVSYETQLSEETEKSLHVQTKLSQKFNGLRLAASGFLQCKTSDPQGRRISRCFLYTRISLVPIFPAYAIIFRATAHDDLVNTNS